jgi:hypothetical protein
MTEYQRRRSALRDKEAEIEHLNKQLERSRKQRDDLKDNAAIVSKEMVRLFGEYKQQIENLEANPQAPGWPVGGPIVEKVPSIRQTSVETPATKAILQKLEALEKRLENLEKIRPFAPPMGGYVPHQVK